MTLEQPLVSVFMISYNHEPYVARAIEGVLAQNFSSSFELVIGEDRSPDNTRRICEEYAAKYPDKIRLLESDRNLGMHKNTVRTLRACRGEYIALCEGDDEWTDPNHLARSVAELQAREELGGVFSDVRWESKNRSVMYSEKFELLSDGNDIFTFDTFLTKGWFVPTCSLVFRAELLRDSYDHLLRCFSPDYTIGLLVTNKKPLRFLRFPVGIHLDQGQGVSSTYYRNRRAIRKTLEGRVQDIRLRREIFDLTLLQQRTLRWQEMYLNARSFVNCLKGFLRPQAHYFFDFCAYGWHTVKRLEPGKYFKLIAQA